MNVVQIPIDKTIRRLMAKIAAGVPLNPAEKALLRWAATQPRGRSSWSRPMEGKDHEPAA